MSDAVWTELEKIDVLRERLGISYEEARFALDNAQGDVFKALDGLENDFHSYKDESFGSQLWDELKHQMIRLNQTQVKLKRMDKTIVSVSAPLGIAMAYTIWRRPSLRLLGLIGTAGALLKDYKLEFAPINGKYQNEQVYRYTYTKPVVDVDVDIEKDVTLN